MKRKNPKRVRTTLGGVRSYPKTFPLRDKYGIDRTWRIQFRRKVVHAGIECFGACHPSDRLIEIELGLGPEKTFEVFLHELHHAFETEWGCKIPHSVIDKLERYWRLFLTSNFPALSGIIQVK